MGTIASIFKQTTFQLIGKLVTSISTFIVLGIVARNYREEGVGIFTLALTYLSIFNLLGDFGFNAHVLRKVENNKESFVVEWNKLFGTRTIWSLILVVLALAILPIFPFASIDFSRAILYGSISILGSAVFVSCNLIFQYKLRYDLSVWASSVGTIAGLFLYLYLSSNNLPVSSLLLAQSLSWVITGLVSILLIKKLIQKFSPVVDYQYIKNLFKDSWPIAGTLALNVVYFRVDSFLIAYFKGVSDVGVYNIAYSVFQSALVFPAFIMNAYYPTMLKTLSKIKLIGIGLIALALGGTVLTYILSPLIVNILTGGDFDGSILSLRILALSYPAFFISALMMWLLVTKGKYKQMLLVYFLGLVLNVALNLIFIPKYSYLGASWITVICEYVILLMQTFVLRGILFK